MAPSRVTEAPQFQWSSLLIGAGRGCGLPHPPVSRSTDQIRSTRAFVSGAGRIEVKYSFLPSGENRGVRSKYCPENGTTSGCVQTPFTKRDTQIIPMRGKLVY